VPLAHVERPGAWPATCAAPAANGAPRAVRQPVDQRHLVRPLTTDGTGEPSPALRSDQRSLRRLGMRARRGYDTYGGWPTWPRTMSRPSASRRSRCICVSLSRFQNSFSLNFQTKVHLLVSSKVEDHTSLYNFHKGW
jgi:hypothetical protein